MIHEKVRIASPPDEEKVKIGFTVLHGYNSSSLRTGLGANIYIFVRNRGKRIEARFLSRKR